jgi:biotin synthase
MMQQNNESNWLEDLKRQLLDEKRDLRQEQALKVLQLSDAAIGALADLAYEVRRNGAGPGFDLCAIVNAKSGACSEDCAFCSQSARFKTAAAVYPLMSPEAMVQAAQQAQVDGVNHFSLVTSGRGMREGVELDAVCEALGRMSQEVKISRCASLGLMDMASGARLMQAGLNRYHHNLETSQRHYGSICSTHSYEERLDTLRLMRGLGAELCSGGIFGMGESLQDRVDLAFVLKELAVESIPINFLNAIEGTPLAQPGAVEPFSAMDAVRVVAMFRLVNPKAEIRLAGGRAACLGDLETLAVRAGLNGLMVGDYLTTLGPGIAHDKQMLKQQGELLQSTQSLIPKISGIAGK